MMFEQEKAQAEALPTHPFDACIQLVRQVDKYQTVLFEEVRYRVPRAVAFETVTVKAYLNQIVIVHKGSVVARHPRNRVAGEQELEPTHYLSVLGRKPAYLDKTWLFTDWKLPTTFTRLRKTLEQKYGSRTGARHYIRVLQLLASHPIEKVESAILACEHRQTLGAEIIAQKLNTLSPNMSTGTGSMTIPDSVPIVHVRPPDLRRFDQLLVHHTEPPLHEGEADVRDATEAQPQDTEAADDAGRACAIVA